MRTDNQSLPFQCNRGAPCAAELLAEWHGDFQLPRCGIRTAKRKRRITELGINRNQPRPVGYDHGMSKRFGSLKRAHALPRISVQVVHVHELLVRDEQIATSERDGNTKRSCRVWRRTNDRAPAPLRLFATKECYVT